MAQEVYRQLLAMMKKRGGGYAGMDIPEFYAMVEELFTPEEAAVNNAMSRGPFRAKDLSREMGLEEADLEKNLEAMADKGLCIAVKMGGVQYYQSARFMPGILEFQFMPGKTTERHRKLARLIQAYKKACDRNTDRTADTFSPMRVITVDRAVAAGNQVHTYDQVQTFIDQNEPIAVTTCYCRHAAVLRDEDVHGMPLDVCMQFGLGAQFAIERLGGRKLTKEEAREVLNRAEEAGLIHMSMNTAQDIGFICNCDRWHCVAVKQALAKPKPALYFYSGFEPSFDGERCVACGTCLERCPAAALTLGEQGPPQVDRDRCFGCAVCATGCPSEAIVMVSRPGFPETPKNGKALGEAIKASMGAKEC